MILLADKGNILWAQLNLPPSYEAYCGYDFLLILLECSSPKTFSETM